SPEYKNIPADDLRLWMIEINASNDEKIANYPLNSEDELHAVSLISDYWILDPLPGHIHVIVVPPGAVETSSPEKQKKESKPPKTANNKKDIKADTLPISSATSTNKRQATPNKKKKEAETTPNKEQHKTVHSKEQQKNANNKEQQKKTANNNKRKEDTPPPQPAPDSKRKKMTQKQGETQTSTPMHKRDEILNDLLADVMEEDEDELTDDKPLRELCYELVNTKPPTNLCYFKIGKALQDRLEELIVNKHKNSREILNTEVKGYFSAGTDFKKEMSRATKIFDFFKDIGESRINRVRATPSMISKLTKDDVSYIHGKYKKSDK
ncbi:6265_t:CDS:1, partial [Dentiscutata heterogama]